MANSRRVSSVRITKSMGKWRLQICVSWQFWFDTENNELVLVITSVDKGDFGLYKCRFENSMGSVHNNVYLKRKCGKIC